ncbi:Uncharacterised protein [uncultured archaeon]|nr:Uncharacterised protein [uncultured archaeon]
MTKKSFLQEAIKRAGLNPRKTPAITGHRNPYVEARMPGYMEPQEVSTPSLPRRASETMTHLAKPARDEKYMKSLNERLETSRRTVQYHARIGYAISFLEALTGSYLGSTKKSDREVCLSMAEPIYQVIKTNQREYKDKTIDDYLSVLEDICPDLFVKLKTRGKKQ